MELNTGHGIVGVRLGELVMTPLGFKGLDIRSRPLTFQRSPSSAAPPKDFKQQRKHAEPDDNPD
jgi:hypothetical protein